VWGYLQQQLELLEMLQLLDLDLTTQASTVLAAMIAFAWEVQQGKSMGGKSKPDPVPGALGAVSQVPLLVA